MARTGETGRRRVLVIANPMASGVTARSERTALATLRRAVEPELVHTSAPLHAVELARAAPESGVDAVVVLGGDGTANEVLNGLGARLPIGLLPAGGTSVLARSVGLPRSVGAAAAQVAAALEAGRTRHIALGTLNGRRYGFAAGIGFDAEAVRRVDARGRRRGRRPGDAYFALQVARLALSGAYARPLLTVETPDGGAERAASVLLANVHPWSYLGPRPLQLAPLADPEGGFDLVVPRHMRRRDVLPLARYVLLDGAHARRRDGRVGYLHDVRAAVVRCDRPLPAEVDGDDIGDVEVAELGVDAEGARLLV